MAGPTEERAPALGADELWCTYPEPPVAALAGVSLWQEAGELVAVMGASGAGKTTLLKCLNRVVPCFQPAQVKGRIAAAGKWLDGESVSELAGRVGMLFQDFEGQLFSTNVAQEVAFGPEQLGIEAEEAGRRVAGALRAVGLEALRRRDPSTLSGGQKQRLAVAALLAMQPRAMLLDEPATDLDPEGRFEVYKTLGRLRGEGLAMLAVEHEIESVLSADRIVLMRRGRVLGEGRVSDIVARVEMFEAAGIRPFELAELAGRLGLPRCPMTAAEAAKSISGAGWWVDENRGDNRSAVRPGASHSPAITLESVSFGYESGVSVLHEVCTTIGHGEFVALVGPNGSGKTTLAKHMNGLLGAYSGRVLLGGRDVSRMPRHEIARKAGYVFQNPDHQLFAPTVFEEIAFGPRNFGQLGAALERKAQEALEGVGLAGVRQHDPFLLSKGERQRLAVASVISLEPEVIILDEPTTGLDYQQTMDVMRLLERLHREGRTVVIITHTPWLVARYAERVLLMAGGRLAWAGSALEFFSRPELLAQAGFEAPPVARVSRALGASALTVERLVAQLVRVGRSG